jgi:hypothetical protein
VGEHVAEGELEVVKDPRTTWTVAAMQQRLETRLQGEETLAQLRAAVDRLDRTVAVLDLHQKELNRWDGADQATKDELLERTREVKVGATGLLNRLRVPPDTKGIVANRTAIALVSTALGRATGSSGAPSAGQLAELQFETDAALALLEEVERFYATEVAEYETAVRESGFKLVGGG